MGCSHDLAEMEMEGETMRPEDTITIEAHGEDRFSIHKDDWHRWNEAQRKIGEARLRAENERLRAKIENYGRRENRLQERVMNSWERVVSKDRRCEGWIAHRGDYWVAVSANGFHEKICRNEREALEQVAAWSQEWPLRQEPIDAAREGERDG